MNPDTLIAVLRMLLAAEPAIIQLTHDLLVGTGGKSDQAVLTADIADWETIAAKAKEQLSSTPTAPPSSSVA